MAAVQKDAGAGEKDKGGGAEVCDPACQKKCGASLGQVGWVDRRVGEKIAGEVIADMVEGHEDHGESADEVDGVDAGGAGRKDQTTAGRRGNCWLNDGRSHGRLPVGKWVGERYGNILRRPAGVTKFFSGLESRFSAPAAANQNGQELGGT